MTEWHEALSHFLIVAGALFFLTGSLGFIRFPDVFTRLHALTKADNLGLGLLCSGLALQAGGLAEAAKIMLVWLLVLLASGIGATLVASTADACGIRPWQNRTGASREARREPHE